MTHFIPIDVLTRDINNPRITIYISKNMPMRVTTDANGQAWLSLADNSVWLLTTDEKTFMDAIDGILENT